MSPFFFEHSKMTPNDLKELVIFILDKGFYITNAPDAIILAGLDKGLYLDYEDGFIYRFFGFDDASESFACLKKYQLENYGENVDLIENPTLESVKAKIGIV